ncbi:MAG: hypothetical protein QOF28_2227 [Actinomycetota bacterium]|nr:hypothetical protein [Actinomycetota bacterium]
MNEQFGNDALGSTIVAEVWSELEPAATRYLAEPRSRERARHRRRSVGLAVTALVIGAGSTAAAARLLIGSPAPPAVQRSIAGVDEGMPADLRLNPDAMRARSVAADGSAVLYAADLPAGGVCTEIALAGRPMGAVCRADSDQPVPVEATIPGTPEDTGALVVVAGRVFAPADGARLVTDDGREIALAVHDGGFFIIELSATESADARQGLRIEADRAGQKIGEIDLSDAFTPENGRLDPIAVEMVSGSGDLTKVVSFFGSVQVKGAATVRLEYPDGTHADARLGANGHYEFVLPLDAQDAFARAPGQLVALDDNGNELASRTVAAVSFWRASGG